MTSYHIGLNLEHKIQEYSPYHAKDLLSWLYGHENIDSNLDMEIGNYDTCLVGEKHGFSGLYANETTEFFCKDCYRFANYLSDEYNRNDFQDFIKDLNKFYDHIESKKHKFEEIED